MEAMRDSDVIDGLSIRYLKIFGIWKIINDYRTTGNKNMILKIQVIVTVMLSVPSILSQYLALFVIEVDIQKATILNFHALPPLQALSKQLVFWFNIDSICRLYNLMRKDFLEKTVNDIEREKVEFIYRKFSRETNTTCLVAFIVINIAGSFVLLFPGISVDYILYHTGKLSAVTTGRRKISTGWYPLPMDTSPCYEIVVLYEGILVMWCGYAIIIFMCLYYQLLMCLRTQFALIVSHVSTLKIDYEYEKNSIEYRFTNQQVYSRMYRILQDHQKLLSYAAELRSVYNPLVTMILGVGMSVLVIAVFQFLFGQRGDLMFMARSFIYVMYQSVEVSMFCFGSLYIQMASSDLHSAIYSSDWYKADVKFRKMAQMMMIRAKKGETLTAIRMYPINAETIMAIFQFTYTVATLMSRLVE
ncbi:odorant receptor 24a-like [Halyomorpha halys]|uniref:odorant receptor 24a-like n=1 Tax=Halyomorpha halys TaxID=286706 RepID=UPI0006D50A2C|nr:Odorant receptor 48 [Halyomorpha halys]